jgi:hypothetical protein
MTLTKWNAELIEGLDESVDGEMEGDYLPLEGGTLTGELTVDANLILEGAITEGTLDYDSSNQDPLPLTLPQDPEDSEVTEWDHHECVISPSQGSMQRITLGLINSAITTDPNQGQPDLHQISMDPEYYFKDGQSMSLRIEIADLDLPKSERYQYLHQWNDDIWWVNTEDGLAPDLNETGAITVNLWKAKGVLYGQLAGDYVKEVEYHPNAFNFKKLEWYYDWRDSECFSQAGVFHHPDAYKYDPFIWDPEGGITYRQGTTFARTTRDGRHFFVGQSGSDGWFDKEYPDHNNELYPGEFRMIGNNIAEDPYTDGKYSGIVRANGPLPQPWSFGWKNKPHPTKPSTDSKLLGTATDMRLRVDKGTGADFNPDGTKMFQSVACYHDPSLKDKYKNVIGFHQLAKPWDVGTTDFLIKEELNDIIYCDEKYSELRALHPEHPDMRVCCLTFRPDGMGFYFAYVLHSLTNQDIEYYFVQQDLTVPWELSSAKEEYKYSDKIFHKKAPVYSPTGDTARTHLWQINGMTVTPNGKYMHAVYPHNYLPGHPKKSRAQNQRVYHGLAKPRQFEMTTPWDISTAGMDTMHVGIGGGRECWEGFPEDTDWPPQIGNPGCDRDEMTHAVHWNESGESCYFSYVPEHEPGFAWGEQPVNKIYYKQNKCVFGPWGGEIADTRKEEETQ